MNSKHFGICCLYCTTLLMLQCTRRESLHWLTSEFLNLCSTGILDQIILCCRGLPLCIVGYLATSLASTNSMPVAFSPVETTKNVLPTLPNVPQVAKPSSVENHWLRWNHKTAHLMVSERPTNLDVQSHKAKEGG